MQFELNFNAVLFNENLDSDIYKKECTIIYMYILLSVLYRMTFSAFLLQTYSIFILFFYIKHNFKLFLKCKLVTLIKFYYFLVYFSVIFFYKRIRVLQYTRYIFLESFKR